jgi:hypothetical protein
MKIYQAVPKLLVGADRQTDDLISLLSFLESRLKRDHDSIHLPSSESVPESLGRKRMNRD